MKVLLVSPKFYGYWSAIAAALERCEHDVVTHVYDGGGITARARNALAYRVPALAPRAWALITAAAVTAVQAVRPDAVLVVRGDVLRPAWWDAVARSGARSAVWLYDELARMTYDMPTLAAVDDVFSYSPRDVAVLAAAGVNAAELPDGFDSLTPFTVRHTDAVTFVGARYPGRERTLRALRDRGVHVIAYGREWSRWPWDIARTGRLRGVGVHAHGALARPDYYGVMAGSLATLNIHGDGHDGLSMRTFEAPGVGALQLVDRPEVARFYDVGAEVLVYSGDDELVDHVRRARREPRWAQNIRDAGRRRTLAEHTLVHRMRQVSARWA